MSVHPIPIEMCYGLLSNAKDTNTFSLCVCVQLVSPSRQCNYALPSHPTLLFSFRAQRASATRLMNLTLLVSLFWCFHNSGLLHDVVQFVSVHPIPIEIVMDCSATRRILTHFLFVFVYL